MLRLGDGRLVRLAGIDVPGPPLDAEDGASSPLGLAALSALAKAVAGGAVLVPLDAEAADRHGRVPGYLRLPGGRTAQEILIEAGLARARWLPGEASCFLQFRAAEGMAEEARLGVWGSPDYATRAADDASLRSRIGLYELVEGRVLSVGHGSRMIFLDFGHDYRRDFTVMVAPKVAEGLASAGVPADALVNRSVRVRGVIEESGGPAIRLNDPAEIEVLD